MYLMGANKSDENNEKDSNENQSEEADESDVKADTTEGGEADE